MDTVNLSVSSVCVSGSASPQYPAAGPFTQLIYKNINVPVYTTLKGVRPPHIYINIFIYMKWMLCNSPLVNSPAVKCFRKPLRSAVCRCLTTTRGQRTTAALWPVYGHPRWARRGRAASQGVHVRSREVTTIGFNLQKEVAEIKTHTH